MLSAILADLLSLALLIVAGPAAIWRVLAIYWAENLGFGLAASIGLRRGMATLSDEAWFARAHATLAAQAARPDPDESQAAHALDIARRQARLAQMESIDRSTPAGRQQVAEMRRLEEGASGLIFGCSFGIFALVHGLFLLFLAGASTFLGSAGGLGGFLSNGPSFLDPSGYGVSGFDPFGQGSGTGQGIDLLAVGWLLLSMAAVLIAALVPALRSRVTMAQGDATLRRALVRLFILQGTIIAGGLLALALGSVAIAVVFTSIKGAADLLEVRRARQGSAGGAPAA